MPERVLVTGGAGFIGCHCTKHFAEKGYEVVIIDNLSRKGTPMNLDWIRDSFRVRHYLTDIRDRQAVGEIFRNDGPFAAVIHLAGQVGVTTSVTQPVEDFEINAQGTILLLEQVRTYSPESLFIYSSTNKVYGELLHLPVREDPTRYSFVEREGISETSGLDFHSPYGCSKGCADQYVVDYARIYGLHTVAFRQSCIYGERQFGVEDQGWVAWFIIAGVLGAPITIYGDGKQVRDLLHVDDLIRLYSLAMEHRSLLKGAAYNIGGGAGNSLSLLEFMDLLREEGLTLEYRSSSPRPGDQKMFISDNGKALAELGWEPKIEYRDGIKRLLAWVMENKSMLSHVLREQ